MGAMSAAVLFLRILRFPPTLKRLILVQLFRQLTATLSGILSDIILQLPDGSATFVQLFAAYKDVLKDQGLDPAEDTEIYSLLLKLGMQKGADWRTKWQNVQRVESTTGSLEVLKSRLDKLDLTSQQQSPFVNHPSTVTNVPLDSAPGKSQALPWTPTPNTMKRRSAPPVTSTPRAKRISEVPTIKTSPLWGLGHQGPSTVTRVRFQTEPDVAQDFESHSQVSFEENEIERLRLDWFTADRFRSSALIGHFWDRWISACIKAQQKSQTVGRARDFDHSETLFSPLETP